MKYLFPFNRLLLPALLLGSLTLNSCDCGDDPKPQDKKSDTSTRK